MSQALFLDTTEFYRIDASLKLDSKKRSMYGQFMTPAPIARFMASLFSSFSGNIRILDPGAGVGSLTAAVAERILQQRNNIRSVEFSCYEIDNLLIGYLQDTINELEAKLEFSQIDIIANINETDFILDYKSLQQMSIFNSSCAGKSYSHVIMNPPYKKINSSSPHRFALRKAGIETSNIYTGFMYLAALQIQEGVEMVAIVPRSFCNGPYFKTFRKSFFSMMTLRHIHLFDKRNSPFKGDDVLQENIIIHAVKGGENSNVKITTSAGGDFETDLKGVEFFSQDMTQRIVSQENIIKKNDPNLFIRIASNDLDQRIVDRMDHFLSNLVDLGIEVSTGPVVDFRLKADLLNSPDKDSVPLLYPAHFKGNSLEWPKSMKKPNAIRISKESRKWLWKNEGYFIVTRRLTSKEERKRIVASIYSSNLPGDFIGFENHLNVFHSNQLGMPKWLALGLALYLNSSLVDRYFRQFNGHTQVNATDLRSLRYPDKSTLERIGKESEGKDLSQDYIDKIIEKEVQHMNDDINPIKAQEKIDTALNILISLGLPRQQQNERSALTLLALLDLKPDDLWEDIKKPLIGITPIMDFSRNNYGREYAPNTRETFRRQTMHQFVEAGIALYNPDKPDRSVNSPKACYQISNEVFNVIKTYGDKKWQKTLDKYLEGQSTLAAKWARHL